jgi:hypothetical protein
MDKAEALKYIETKGDSKFVIRTEEEEATFLINHAKEIEEKTIPTKIKAVHDQYDQDVLSITGLKKDQTEKTYDFLKRVINSYKTDAEKAKILEGEIAELKKSGTDKKTLADLEQVRKAYKELEEGKTKEITTLKTDFDKYKNKSEILSALSGMTFKKSIEEDVRQSFTDRVIEDLSNMSARQDGKLVFLNADGTVMRNVHNALEPYTAKELLDERLKSIKETGKPANGGPGLEQEITFEKDDKGNIKKVNIVIPATVQYKEDLSEFLVKSGLLRESPEYLAAYRDYSPGLKWKPK